MITDIGMVILEEDDKMIKVQYNKVIYDEHGYPTRKYDDSDPNIITMIKHPLFDSPIEQDKQ